MPPSNSGLNTVPRNPPPNLVGGCRRGEFCTENRTAHTTQNLVGGFPAGSTTRPIASNRHTDHHATQTVCLNIAELRKRARHLRFSGLISVPQKCIKNRSSACASRVNLKETSVVLVWCEGMCVARVEWFVMGRGRSGGGVRVRAWWGEVRVLWIVANRM